MLNIYEQVAINKRRTALIILIFVAFFVGFAWLIVNFFQADQGIIFYAGAFSIFSSFAGYFWGDKIILTISGAKEANKKDYFNFYTAVENLAIASQIPLPKLYVIETPAMNAFATGRDPKNAVVCATTGLIEKLNKTELEAVIAHEISHITNYDIRLMTIVGILVGMISIVVNSLWRLGRIGFRSSDDDRGGNPIFMIFGLLMIIISPIVARLIQLALSRRREYFADASAVKLTRQPEGLINALKKLNDSKIPVLQANQATAHLYIVNPFKNLRGSLRKFANMFSTHPPIEERIAALQKML